MTGRPPLYPSGALIPVGVRLDMDTIAKARTLGGGNLSAGLRLAVALAQPDKLVMDPDSASALKPD